ncbi:kynureninase [Plantactinospora sp. S1510]|uniref:Kynureninase n=1 Tax=Plantactinospora alkalitolerans TaxID=2789879 RepID=A0ABS0GN18_9ACTN|nr:kynureninase [Plantactinospora alkalitolerans]MBF9127581.1 kynureninase [Plantactinospora alkalitolerans]
MTTPEAEATARRRDEADPGHRHLFHVPPAEGGRYPEAAYLVGNSLGLQPRAARSDLLAELDAWATRGVSGHFSGDRPWVPSYRSLTGPSASLVGALPDETVVMNSLTVNLHLLMVSFYRPAGARNRILIEDAAFPSDSYAVRSQARHHGLDPDEAVVRLRPRPGEETLRTEDVVAYLDREGDRVALVLLGGVNYLTGEVLDIPAITEAGHRAGALVGWDLAHAVGNVPLALHDWNVDFAAWCTYKYLNSGPGALAGIFVHQRHLGDPTVNRFEGWWGTDEATRFEMAPVSRPPATAEAWLISNPPVLAMAPMRSALGIFEEVGMAALRDRSERLTGYLEQLLDQITPTRPITVITPRDPARRGCQLSVRIGQGGAAALTRRLWAEYGVLVDDREPDVIRLAPVPLYSTYHDCWRAVEALAGLVDETGQPLP